MIKFLNLAFDSMCYIVYLIDTQMSNTDMKPILIKYHFWSPAEIYVRGTYSSS